MQKPSVHTVPTPGGWNNKVDGQILNPTPIPTKVEAVKQGRTAARQLQTEHVISKKDGTFKDKNSYGNDPRPPKGSRG